MENRCNDLNTIVDLWQNQTSKDKGIAMKKIFLLIIIVIAGCSKKEITTGNAAAAEKVFGLNFTASERDSLLDGLNERLGQYEQLRTIDLPNHIGYPLYYNPLVDDGNMPRGRDRFQFTEIPTVRPKDLEQCAFMTIPELAYLIRTQKVKSEELTRMYLERLKRYGPELECVVTITETLAIQQARKADLEIARGRYRGPLHGIPWGAKDLLAVPEYKTTWGAAPYKDQILDGKATVVQKLEEAGAVLVAKLTLGALALSLIHI